MDSKFGNLRFLVIPTGQTTGQRIEFDGNTGEIRIYSASGNLILQLDGASGLRFFEDIVGGGLVGTHQPSDFLMIDPDALANTFEVLPTGSGVDVLLWGKSLPRGRMGTPFESTGNDASARAAGRNADAVMTVDTDGTRLYVVHLHSQFLLGTLSTAYRINAVEDGTVGGTNGTVVGTLDRINNAESANGTVFSNGSVLWKPSTGTHTIGVQNDAASGGTIQGQGSAANPRQLWVEDIGTR